MNPAKKILIIEDEDIIAIALRYTLEELGYMVTDVLRSGEEALASIEVNYPDIILMDIKIEGEMDGIDTSMLIQKTYNIPIIFLTSYSNAETLERAKKTNPFGYIIKPYHERELYTTIEITYHKHKHDFQIKESERKYRELTESIQHIVIELDFAGKILFLNEAGMKMLAIDSMGLSKGVFLSQLMEKPAFDELLKTLLSGLDKKDNHPGFDISLRSKAGKTYYVKQYLTPVIIHGNVTGYRGVIIDVSSDILKNRLHYLYETITLKYNISTFNLAKLIEFVLKSLNDIFPNSPDISYYSVFDEREKSIFRLNGKTERYTKDIFVEYIKRERRSLHLSGKKIQEFARSHGNNVICNCECWVGFPFHSENKVIGVFCLKSNSDPYYISCSDFPAVAAFIKSLESFIENNLLKSKVKVSEARYSELIENINEGVLHNDKAGNVIYANNRFCEMVGLRLDELIEKKEFSFLNDYPEKKKFLLNQLASDNVQNSVQHEFLMPVAKNDVKQFIINVSPLRNNTNSTIGTISTWIDITENRTLTSRLSESEQKLREIADNVSGAFWIIDWRQNEMQFVNPAFFQIFDIQPGYSEKALFNEWKSHALTTIEHPLFQYMHFATEVNSYDVQYKIHTRSGRVKWIHEKASGILSENGRLDRIVGYSTDITTRKNAEECLAKNEKEKETILSQLLDTIVSIGSNGYIRSAYIKKNEESLFQLPVSEISRKNISDIFPESIAEMLYSFISMRGENQNSHVFEYEHKTAVGRKWYELRIVRGTSGDLIIIIRNITNEKHYFIEMRKFYNIISQTNELIMITDNAGKIEFINETFSRVTGYEMSEILGKQPRFLNSGKHKRKFYLEMWQTIRSNNSFSAEFINRKKNGEIYFEEKIITPLVNEKGEISKFISTGRDITEKKKAERKLLAYAKREKLQEKNTEKLRTTALIQGQELERMRLARELHDGLGQILTAAKFNIEHFNKNDFKNLQSQSLIRSIRKLVNNSIKETRKISDNLSPVGLSDYGLEYVVRRMISEIVSGKAIIIKLSSNLRRTRFDPSTEINVFRIVQESINNSLKHSKATLINVVLKRKEDSLRIKVSDNGIGMDETRINADKNKRYGLRNIRERAKIINADCTIKSVKNKGTEIEIKLEKQKI